MKVRTLYGVWEVAHPAVMRLVQTPQVQRLKHVHQYGVRGLLRRAGGRFTRYQHSLGVAHLVAHCQGSWQAQAAALLHDVGHAAFSHDLEPLLCSTRGTHGHAAEAPHEHVTAALLQQQEVADILAKEGAAPQDIAASAHDILETPLPRLCADRLDYNLQGAVRAGLWSRRQLRDMLAALHYDHAAGAWCVSDTRAAAALMNASIHMSATLWPGIQGAVMAHWLQQACAAMLRAGLWTWEDVVYGTDAVLWAQLQLAPVARPWVERLRAPARFMTTDARHAATVPQAQSLMVTTKFRGVDPLVPMHGSLTPLTHVSKLLRLYFCKAQANAAEGVRVFLW